MDLDRQKFTKNIGGEDLIIEKSNLAEQANAAVMGTYGGTTVLATVVMEDKDVELDYMPLKVDYEEKFYAVGKIPGGFFKREGRPSSNAVLSGRLIDHAIRPLFDKRIRRPIQVTVTVLSYDGEHDLDFVALNTVSSALSISDIPWNGPIAGVNVDRVDGNLVVNPTKSSLEEENVEFSTFFSGAGGYINMIELEGDDASEEHVTEAAREAMKIINELDAFQADIAKKIGKEKIELKFDEPSVEFLGEMKEFLGERLEKAVYVEAKTERMDKVSDVKTALEEHLTEKFEEELKFLDALFEKELDDLVHKNILENDRRPDGRALDEVRDLYAETGILPRTHGSGLFIRGGTQALGVVTLGPPGAQQLVETIERFGKESFLLHYNFPPFSVGEARSFRGPGRRDIGHGALAEKALESWRNEGIISATSILNELTSEELKGILTDVTLSKYELSAGWQDRETEVEEPPVARIAQAAVNAVKRVALKKQIEKNQLLLKEASQRGQETLAFVQRHQELLRSIKELERPETN